MLSLFLNPWTFVAGAALVSAPIIIHLIHRIRFRKVRWAAMEFLLKAQKRMRRRKILEQLILLLLRCLLVFLAAMLLGRFLGCGPTDGAEVRGTAHLVLLDDTPSMGDGAAGEGDRGDALAAGKRLVVDKLLPAVAEATTPQTLQVFRLSEPGGLFPVKKDDARVTADGIEAVRQHLRGVAVSPRRRTLIEGLDAALAHFGPAGNEARVLHVVTDLRAADWAEGGPALTAKLAELKGAGVAVHLIDVAGPARKGDRRTPPAADNVSIVEVRPAALVAAVNQPVEVAVRVRNNGAADLKNVRAVFYVNGELNNAYSLTIPSLPPFQERTGAVEVRLRRTGTADRPLDRFNLLTAELTGLPPGDLPFDNTRHAVVEVRDRLKVLVVEGRPDKRGTAAADGFQLGRILRTVLEPPAEALDVVTAEGPELDALDLSGFAAVYLVNVPELGPRGAANVRRYAESGGGVGVFLGPDVKADPYNELLYDKGRGVLPVPLPADGFSKELTAQDRERREKAFARIYLRTPANRQHPALAGLYTNSAGAPVSDNEIERFFAAVDVDLYWPVRRGAWRDDPKVRELYCLPNDKSIAPFEKPAGDLAARVRAVAAAEKFKDVRKFLFPRLAALETLPAQVGTPLSALADELDRLLCDQINKGDPAEPALRDFWAQPELAEVRPEAARLRDEAKYGDPLYLVKDVGRGRVALMTVDAGGVYDGNRRWTNWSTGPGANGWGAVMIEMQKYLSGGGSFGNLVLGDRLQAAFPADLYRPTAARHLMTVKFPPPGTDERPEPVLAPLGEQPLERQPRPEGAPADLAPRPLELNFADAKRGGVYLFTLTRLKADGEKGQPDARPEFLAVPFNVDAAREGDLRRANTDDVIALSEKAPLHNSDDLTWIEEFKRKPTDLSSRRWLYFLILLVLLAEQAWAVRLSYHSRPEDLDALAPSAAAAFAGRTAVAAPAEAAPAEAAAR